MTTHGPVVPVWSCAGCNAPWPCATRRRQLLAEYDRAPTSLTIYLAAQFVDASQDLTSVPAGRLYHRFLGWVR